MGEAAEEALTVRYAVRSDIGLTRADNEDAAYAGDRLLAIADGMGGHAAGEVASAAVISALRPLDTQVPSGELLNALGHAVQRAEGTLRDLVAANPSLQGMGTTVTALLRSGSRIGLAHIGDTRAYLVRGGEVFQHHPRPHRGAVAARRGQDHRGRGGVAPAAVPAAAGAGRGARLRARPPAARRAGRRPASAASDGLHATVAAQAIARVLVEVADPDEAAEELIKLAMDGGGPDNVTCIVADIVPAG